MLRAAMGAEIIDRPTTRATLAEPVRSAAGRRDFVRVRLEGGRARLTGSQSSGAVTSLAKADGLAVIPEEVAELSAGAEIDVILWR